MPANHVLEIIQVHNVGINWTNVITTASATVVLLSLILALPYRYLRNLVSWKDNVDDTLVQLKDMVRHHETFIQMFMSAMVTSNPNLLTDYVNKNTEKKDG